MTGPSTQADRIVLDIDPGLGPLGVEHQDAVLVTGGWMAGSTTLAAELRGRLKNMRVVESEELPPSQAPAVVVYVCSGIAPLTTSDCNLVDLAAASTDAVVGVVSKIDVHQSWRDVLQRNSEILAHHDKRFRGMPWLGVSTRDGGVSMDALVQTINRMRAEGSLVERNRLRAWETKLHAILEAAAAPGEDQSADVLRNQRQAVVRRNRASKSERVLALRNRIAQARVSLQYFARQRIRSVTTELAEDIGELRRGQVAGFVEHARRRMDEVVTDVETGADDHLAEVASEVTYSRASVYALSRSTTMSSPPEPNDPPIRSRRLETRMMALFGVFFGLGAALTVSRLVAYLRPEMAPVGLAVGLVAGACISVWLVAVRGLLHDRAVLERWVNESMSELRTYLEQWVATRVLDVETRLNADLAAVDDRENDKLSAQVNQIDTQLREQAMNSARATALRNRDLPAVRRALSAVAQRLDAGARGDENQSS